MTYTMKAWLCIAATPIEINQDDRPACTEQIASGSECGEQPDHIVTYTVNHTGLPGLGKNHAVFVCDPHLSRVTKQAEQSDVAGHATVTAYEGV
ncbi:hypothetical protein [Streptomyces noursei]|uniref:Uncharacterized protein n=1 Tax=Streptomyces noursei TaxID=1971 RepID=A0A2N8PQU7_STRNR|nr:hypothetical protein [Streptomyces noursei]PNE43402.1 hypothetical protein AOB60_00180 [Streptomyces noursei]